MKRAKYKRIKDKEPAECWYCHQNAFGILIFSDNSEVYACEVCAGKQGKIKKLIRKALNNRSSKKIEISLLKK